MKEAIQLELKRIRDLYRDGNAEVEEAMQDATKMDAFVAERLALVLANQQNPVKPTERAKDWASDAVEEMSSHLLRLHYGYTDFYIKIRERVMAEVIRKHTPKQDLTKAIEAAVTELCNEFWEGKMSSDESFCNRQQARAILTKHLKP